MFNPVLQIYFLNVATVLRLTTVVATPLLYFGSCRDLRHENYSKLSSTRHFHPSDCCNDTSTRDYHEPDEGKELVNLTDRHKLQ
ncbi:hypothetical protein JTE90_014595 [Oedothorax gibbosus]|uniref:Secreted protein n=1 Tax=Oedothorax gibbosus TaxID=931172 RepID=A0AAV6VAW7_9ARAC|nr:hypothetical protein JTE90_014595 [Oedothorax gibbosus]